MLAALDADDLLGRTEIKVPAEGPAEETKEWRFEHKDGIGFSSWEYTVRYRIFRSK